MKQKCYKYENYFYICSEQSHRIMRMYSYVFNTYSELTDFVNANGISKEQIVDIFPQGSQFCLSYYAE